MPAWFDVVVDVVLEPFTWQQVVGVELRVVAFAAGAFDVGLELRDGLVSVRGKSGAKTIGTSYGGSAFRRVLEWVTGADQGRGARALFGVGILVDSFVKKPPSGPGASN